MRYTFYWIFILLYIPVVKAQDTIYFDQDWNESTRQNHTYYRLIPLKKLGELVLIQDYHKNGKLQMQGYVKTINEESYVGDVYYYDENGLDESFRQYENKSAVKELIYYHDNGSIWQKTSYDKEGKKENIKIYLQDKIIAEAHIDSLHNFSGNFSYAQPILYYESIYEEESNLSPPIAVAVESVPIIAPEEEVTAAVVENKPEHFYHITTFWENGKIASQQKVNYSPYYGTDVIEEKYYDKTGNLLSSLHKDRKNNHTKYDYFTKNYIAQSVKESTQYLEAERHGLSIAYTPNSEIKQETVYNHDLMMEMNIFKNGKLIQKNSYKDNEPYDGNFEIHSNGLLQKFTLTQGVKTGKETTISSEDASLIADGLFQNGICWEGYFLKIQENENVHVLTYKNGKLEGTQRIYSSTSLHDLLEEYETENGLRNGIRKIYNSENLIAESTYRNDLPFEGTVIDHGKQSTYKNGKLTTQGIYRDSNSEDMTAVESFNEDGSLKSVNYFDFTIAENPQEHYIGTYKNNQPYDGYFKADTILDDIQLLSFYDKGTLKYKYSFDFLAQLDGYRHYVYNQKTTYQNMEVIDGPKYKPIRQGLLTYQYQEGKISSMQVNLFAMHYFNRISFRKENNELWIEELQSPQKIKVFIKDQTALATLYQNDTALYTKDPLKEVKEASPNSITYFYFDKKENKISTKSYNILPEEDYEFMDQNALIVKFLPHFPYPNLSTIDTVFSKFVSWFDNDTDIEQAFNYIERYAVPISPEEYLCFIVYNEQGKIRNGIRLQEQANKSILAEGIYENKVKNKRVFENLKELLADDKVELNKILEKVLND